MESRVVDLALVIAIPSINTLRPRQNGRRFFDDYFKCIFNENISISINISLKFIPKVPIKNNPAFGSDNGLAPTRLDYWRIYTTLGLNESIVFPDGN